MSFVWYAIGSVGQVLKTCTAPDFRHAEAAFSGVRGVVRIVSRLAYDSEQRERRADRAERRRRDPWDD